MSVMRSPLHPLVQLEIYCNRRSFVPPLEYLVLFALASKNGRTNCFKLSTASLLDIFRYIEGNIVFVYQVWPIWKSLFFCLFYYCWSHESYYDLYFIDTFDHYNIIGICIFTQQRHIWMPWLLLHRKKCLHKQKRKSKRTLCLADIDHYVNQFIYKSLISRIFSKLILDVEWFSMKLGSPLSRDYTRIKISFLLISLARR